MSCKKLFNFLETPTGRVIGAASYLLGVVGFTIASYEQYAQGSSGYGLTFAIGATACGFNSITTAIGKSKPAVEPQEEDLTPE